MSTTRIPNSMVNLQAVLPTSIQPSTDTSQGATISSSTGSSSSQISALNQVNLFDSKTYQATVAALMQLGQSSAVSLPSDPTTSSDSNSDDPDSNEWAGGIATLPPSLQQVPASQRESINAAASKIATAVYNTPVAELSAYNKQVTSPSAAVTGAGALATAQSGLNSTTSGGITASQAVPGPNTLQGAMNAAQTSYTQAVLGGNYDQSVQAVSYMGVLGLQQQLGNYASYVQGNQANMNEVNTDISEVNQALASWPAGQATQPFTWHELDKNGNLVTKSGDLTQDQAKTLQGTLNDTLSSMSDQSQTDQLKLQNMAQQYQEGITTISNMMSMEYNTTKNTLNNIHY